MGDKQTTRNRIPNIFWFNLNQDDAMLAKKGDAKAYDRLLIELYTKRDVIVKKIKFRGGNMMSTYNAEYIFDVFFQKFPSLVLKTDNLNAECGMVLTNEFISRIRRKEVKITKSQCELCNNQSEQDDDYFENIATYVLDLNEIIM